MTTPVRPTPVQIGQTCQRVHFLAVTDPGVYHALRRVTDALTELRYRLAEGEYSNDLRPTDPEGAGSVGGSRDPDEPQWTRALQPLKETRDARNDHKNAADQLSKLANSLQAMVGWADPPKGRRDRRGRLQVESVGPDGIRRIG